MSRPHFFFFLFIFVFFFLVVPGSSHGTGDHDHDGDEPTKGSDLGSRSLILNKIGCLVVIFVVTLASGVSPYFLKWSEGFLVVGTQFAGGVFLATALMHFLPDADETFEDLLPSRDYPFAFMLASFGYLLTMLSDCVVSLVCSKSQPPRESADLELQGGTQQQKMNQNNTSHSHLTSSSHTASSVGDSVLLIIALCFHSVFEGIAIGVSDSKSDAWRALWTITLHKIFAAIAMGIALLRMMPNRPFLSSVAYSFAFAISSPIGVAIGIIIDATTQGSVADWIFAVSMGLACGVFVYVSVNHLLAKGYSPLKRVYVDQPLYKFLAVSLGVVLMAIVMIWDE
ncbi:PREDICTED: zinc transporter 11 [Tarenaya hassleriana]|uniref:zinc transporter 11 n=1 Tax=Tarenaya hassleriana TaxID=28532 RepID=UPI00053C6BAB|nr:PREDICTED: zinc transporter 11 [Tarenaya hassleriana]